MQAETRIVPSLAFDFWLLTSGFPYPAGMLATHCQALLPFSPSGLSCGSGRAQVKYIHHSRPQYFSHAPRLCNAAPRIMWEIGIYDLRHLSQASFAEVLAKRFQPLRRL